MVDDDAPAIPSSRKNSEKDSSRKKRRRRKQKYSSKSKRIRYDSTDSSLLSDSEHVDERRKKGKKKVRRARSRSRDRLDVSERGKTKERKNKKRKEKKKKKSGKEKSRIRDASAISYSSSSTSEHVKRTRRRRSRSCSTCRSGSSSPEGRGRGKSLKNRNFDKKKVSRRHGKHRSLSCSSSGGSSTSSRSRSRERVGKGSRQRRSKVVEKGYDFGGEDGRVEITPDYADFPSSRSNDSFDEVNKREGRVTSEQSPQRFVGEGSHDEAEEKGSGSTYARNSEDAYEGNGVQCIHGVDEDVEPSVRLKSIVVVPVDSTKVDDLELTLRQKALENLKKFRGQASSSLKSPTNKKIVLMDTSEKRDVKIQEDHSREYVSDVSKKNLTMSMIDKGGTQDGSSQFVSGGKPSEKPPNPMVNLTTIREGNSGDQVTKHPDISIQREIASDGMPLTTTREGNSGDQVTKHPDISIRPEIASDNMPLTTTREENSGGQVTKHPDVSIRPQVASDKMPLRPDLVVHKHKDSLRQVQREQVKRNENLSMPSSVGCGILDSGNTKQIHSTVSEIKLAQESVSGPSSIPDQAAGTNNNNDAKGEPKTESELEKKTMTVMRGGEMVQVSYKVYIPKKSPALARRQLQR